MNQTVKKTQAFFQTTLSHNVSLKPSTTLSTDKRIKKHDAKRLYVDENDLEDLKKKQSKVLQSKRTSQHHANNTASSKIILQKDPLTQSSNTNHNVSMVSPALTKNQYSTTRVNRSCTPNSHIARLAQPKNKVEIKKKTATIPAVTIQSKTIEKVDEKTKKRELVKLKLGALVKGYKVRRIFSHNRQIAQLRHELIDLVKFIDILQKEINQNMKVKLSTNRTVSNNYFIENSSINQAKGLLSRSIKDLSQKRKQFCTMMYEALANPQWMQNSRKPQKSVLQLSHPKLTSYHNSQEKLPQIEEKKKENEEPKGNPSAIFKGRRRSAGTAGTTPQPLINQKKQIIGRNTQMGNLSQSSIKINKIRECTSSMDLNHILESTVSQPVIKETTKKSCDNAAAKKKQINKHESKKEVIQPKKKQVNDIDTKKCSREIRKSVDFNFKKKATEMCEQKIIAAQSETPLIDLPVPTAPFYVQSEQLDKQILTPTKKDKKLTSHDYLDNYCTNSISQALIQPVLSPKAKAASRSAIRLSQQELSITSFSQDLKRPSSHFRKSSNLPIQETQENPCCPMEQLIKELKDTASSIETAQKQHKTMETLNAISGMLESLKNNKIDPLQTSTVVIRRERSTERIMNKSMRNPPLSQLPSDTELKSKFDSLLSNLQNEFNSMLEARQILMEQQMRRHMMQ